MIFGTEIVELEGECLCFVPKIKGKADAAAATGWRFYDELWEDGEAARGLGHRTVEGLSWLRRPFVAGGMLVTRMKLKAVDFCRCLVGKSCCRHRRYRPQWCNHPLSPFR